MRIRLSRFLSLCPSRDVGLLVLVGAFWVLSVANGGKRTMGYLARWQPVFAKADAHSLRLEFHDWYRRQHVIWNWIARNTSPAAPLLINRHRCPGHFFSYYLAPRPVYRYSPEVENELAAGGRPFYILTMSRDEDQQQVEWSVEGRNTGPGELSKPGVNAAK